MERTTYPDKKVEVLQELEQIIKQSKAIYLAEFSGLNVQKMTELRDQFYEKGAKICVAKNTLMKLALNNSGIKELDPYLQGPNIFAFTDQDPTVPAKIIFNFAKENGIPKLKSCLFEGLLYGPDKIEAIKDLPSREEAIATLLAQMQAPLSNFLGLLNEIIRSFLGVLDAIIEEKKKAEAA